MPVPQKMPVLPIPKPGYWQDASSTDSQARILARCQFHRFPSQDTGKMPVPPIPKPGYWQDASSTDSQARILARCPFHRFPSQDTGKMPVPLIPLAGYWQDASSTDSRFPTPYSLLPTPEWQSRLGNI
ncbi:MAG: hypothetical protein F6J90_37360 [Moorea sp. SIOASIH]|uniref:hypothetical protein n=1 Tax=Moorena sp. SIOASIH TaxID=2607817 RepID=UPI0013B5EA5E|nr:hypothetical protein [Moorena sp. SIOASIH]NEO41688.1 hypothetical protein [Moorena sp. SIOASIH]